MPEDPAIWEAHYLQIEVERLREEIRNLRQLQETPPSSWTDGRGRRYQTLTRDELVELVELYGAHWAADCIYRNHAEIDRLERLVANQEPRP